MEHISRNQFHRTHAFQVIPQPFQNKGSYHLRLAHSTVSVNLHHKNTAVILLHGKQRTVTRITANLLYLLINHRQTGLLHIPEIIHLLLQRSNNSLDISVRSRNIKITDLRERNQLLRGTQKTDHIRYKIRNIGKSYILRIIQPVIIRQILHIPLLENHQLLHHPMFHYLTTVVIRIHIRNKPGQTIRKERRIRTQIQQLQIIIRSGLIQTVHFMERIFPLLCIRHNTGMLLYRLLGRNHPALPHQLIDPANPPPLESLQSLILHLKAFIN